MDPVSGFGISDNQPQALLSSIRSPFHVNGALGNDAWIGDMEHPFQTIQRAIEAASFHNSPGADSIYIHEGLYPENLLINDPDFLTLIGAGEHPWSATVDGSSNPFQHTATIIGSSDVRFRNLRLTGSFRDGINAQDTDYVFLKNVLVDQNLGNGFYGMNNNRTKIYESKFLGNAIWGANVSGGNFFRSEKSLYSLNLGGVFVRDVFDVQLKDVFSISNGLTFFAPESPGATAIGIERLSVVGGHYDLNGGNGFGADEVWDATFSNVNAGHNDGYGVSTRFRNRLNIYGGNFTNNSSSGYQIIGYEVVDTRSPAERFAQAFNSHFGNNEEFGFSILDVLQANLHSVDSRGNGFSGVNVENSNRFNSYGGFFFENGWDGIQLNSVNYGTARNVVSRDNGFNGIISHDGHRLNVIGGYFGRNQLWGINANGNRDGIFQRVDVKNATVAYNYQGGIFINWSQLAKVFAGSVRDNHGDGIYISNTVSGFYEFPTVQDNSGHGLFVESGANGGTQPSYAGQGSWSQYELLGGIYKGNGNDGVSIATYGNNNGYSSYLHLNAKYVVARDNGGSGMNVGGQQNEEFNSSSSTHLHANIQGGYYGYNNLDGIYLLGVITNPPQNEVDVLSAKIVDVVAEYNGRFGVRGSGAVSNIEYDYFTPVMGRPNYYSLINVQRGFFAFNGAAGVEFQLLADANNPSLSGQAGGNHYLVGTFDQVVANNNAWGGLTLQSIFASDSNDDFNELSGHLSNGDDEEVPIVQFWGGVFNQNGIGGVNLNATVIGNDPVPAIAYSGSINMNDVVAINNRSDGLRVVGDGFFSPSIRLHGGVFNLNQGDGIHLENLGDVEAAFISAISNHDDGLESRNNSFLGLTFEVLVGNLDQNLEIA